MKKQLILIGLLLLTLCIPNRSTANRAAAGELIYEWVSDSTYRFIFKFYTDCSGDTASLTAPLCFKNNCSTTTYSYTMNRWLGALPGGSQNGNTVSPGCSFYKTKCDSPASTIPGFKEYWYTTTVTLPYKCNAWTAFTYVNYRNASNNIQNATAKQMYLECGLNNSGTYQGISSPYLSIKPLPYTVINAPFSYNSGAIDPNADSITTDIIATRTGVSTCTDAPTNVVLNAMSPALSIPNNPFQTNNTFVTNSITGQVTFSPSQAGHNIFTTRVRKYRAGILLGWITRDVDVVISTYTSTTPNISAVPINITNGTFASGRVEACINQALSFTFYTKSNDTDAVLTLSDNHTFSIPNATVNYINQKNDSVSGVFTWTPAATDAGSLKTLIVTVLDSTCKAPGIKLYYSKAYSVYVWPITTASNDTTICSGSGYIYLSVTGGSNYLWTVIPGGSSGSLSCSNCATPVATPTITTSYIVQSQASSFCINSKDTVNITINQSYPLTKGHGDTAICFGNAVQLSASGGTGSYNWIVLPGGSSNSLSCYACASPVANPALTTKYLVHSNPNSCIMNHDTVTVKVNPITPKSPSIYIAPNNVAPLIPGAAIKFTAYITDCNNYQLQWVRNGIYVPGETNNVWVTNTIQNNDVITCKFTCSILCPAGNPSPLSNAIKMYVITGVEQIANNSDMAIIPNPNNGKFTVDLRNITGETTLSVTNTLGETIYTQTCFGGKQQEISLDAPKGMYFLHINNSVLKFVITP
jgi:hypothetical protein